MLYMHLQGAQLPALWRSALLTLARSSYQRVIANEYESLSDCCVHQVTTRWLTLLSLGCIDPNPAVLHTDNLPVGDPLVRQLRDAKVIAASGKVLLITPALDALCLLLGAGHCRAIQDLLSADPWRLLGGNEAAAPQLEDFFTDISAAPLVC